MIGKEIYNLCKILYPLNRSLTGEGNRKTLKILKKYNRKLKIKEIKCGKKVFDWIVPKEWNVKENEDTLQLYKEITKRIQMKMEELDPRPLYR